MWMAHTHECPLDVLCQPSTKMGPIVYVNTKDNPRLYPKISRKSKQFKKLMNLRSGCERSNSVKKVTYKLGRRVCRNATHFLLKLYLVSIVEHACVWLSDELQKFGDNTKKLIKDILSSVVARNSMNPPQTTHRLAGKCVSRRGRGEGCPFSPLARCL